MLIKSDLEIQSDGKRTKENKTLKVFQSKYCFPKIKPYSTLI